MSCHVSSDSESLTALVNLYRVEFGEVGAWEVMGRGSLKRKPKPSAVASFPGPRLF